MALSWFWSEKFWLPAGGSWKDLENNDPNIYLPQVTDMLWTVPFGLVLVILRYVYEKLFVIPIGEMLGIKERRPVDVEDNIVLETAFKKYGVPNNNNMEMYAKQTDMTVRQIEIWFRNRKIQSLPSNMQKFCECSWHFTFYLGAFVYGVVILWNKSWFWETIDCWKGWPRQAITPDVYWYYFVELAFYWCLVFTLLTDHKRKDFLEMIVHHVATILLVFFSWVVNFVRIGTLVLMVHDAADYWMAGAKMAKYTKHQTVCEILFVAFIIVWVLSRLTYYPFVVLNSSLFEANAVLDLFPSFIFFNLLLVVLQILHLIWTYMIARIAVQKIIHGELKKDVRSDSESDSD